MNTIQRQRLLTGDTPTGKLHLGHWVGSLENRVKLQEEYDCYFIIANIHAFTTRATQAEDIRQSVIDITLDYLGAGIDPKKSTIFVQSEIPAIAELTYFFSMLVPYAELMRNPTIKDEIRDKNLGDSYPFGFLLYPIGQIADILAFRPDLVPVGEDQLPHLELTRFIARKFNHVYCGVDSHINDEEYVKAGGLFPLPKPLIGRIKRLIGTGAPTADGRLLKMSKSLNNAIFLSDDNDSIQRKVMKIYTDPNRLKPTDKGTTENNPLWIFHDVFNTDSQWVEEAKALYRAGEIGDVACKKRLVDILVALISPMRERREYYANDIGGILRLLQEGNAKANAQAEITLGMAKEALKQTF
ncbi:MAG: tryptophan--tRNA ligase [Gammaproteobacteria bacterium]|nr:tryptophan--tRNA ligase [Gammaproteobacteria bacterium]